MDGPEQNCRHCGGSGMRTLDFSQVCKPYGKAGEAAAAVVRLYERVSGELWHAGREAAMSVLEREEQ